GCTADNRLRGHSTNARWHCPALVAGQRHQPPADQARQLRGWTAHRKAERIGSRHPIFGLEREGGVPVDDGVYGVGARAEAKGIPLEVIDTMRPPCMMLGRAEFLNQID